MALRRVDGVESAAASYETGSGEVVYDPARTSPEVFLAELERMTGFTGVVRKPQPLDTHEPADTVTTEPAGASPPTET